MCQVLATVTNTVGQLNYTFLTDLRLDESKTARVNISPETISTGSGLLAFKYAAATQIYQPLNTAGYNWLITVIFLLKNSVGATVDFPVGGIAEFSINLEWDCESK